MPRRAPLTFILLGAITLVWLFEALIGAPNSDFVMEKMGAILPGMLDRGEYWRLIAAMFLHASWLHWAANSWALYQLGTLYEMLFGTKRLALVYFASGICASAAASMWNLHADVLRHAPWITLNLQPASGPAVGASGAIFGLLGAFIFSIRRSPRYRHQAWTRSLNSQIIFWIVVNIAIGLGVKMIDNVAHLGGLVAGLILGFLPQHVPPPPPGGSVIDIEPYHNYGGE
jgi:rhomboid protease GluP